MIGWHLPLLFQVKLSSRLGSAWSWSWSWSQSQCTHREDLVLLAGANRNAIIASAPQPPRYDWNTHAHVYQALLSAGHGKEVHSRWSSSKDNIDTWLECLNSQRDPVTASQPKATVAI